MLQQRGKHPTAPRRGLGTGSTHLTDGVLWGAALLCWQLQ